jgi:hypothetical protein
VSDGVLLRALARGDANVVLRNILYRLNQKAEWAKFEEDLSQIFPGIRIKVKFDNNVDQFIDISMNEGEGSIPLDLAGTGVTSSSNFGLYTLVFSENHNIG